MFVKKPRKYITQKKIERTQGILKVMHKFDIFPLRKKLEPVVGFIKHQVIA